MVKIYQILAKIQEQFKAPKNQYNSFGGYNYRNKEDILEGLKPLIAGVAFITVDDDIVLIGNRFYSSSTATITCLEDGSSFSASGFAREAETKKGMDVSQITGAAASYSGKRALGNLLAIDDTKDSDYPNEPANQYNPNEPANQYNPNVPAPSQPQYERRY